MNILPFWYRMRTDSGFLGGLRNDLTPIPGSPISLVMISRLLWTYSRAFILFRDERSIEFAHQLYAFLQSRFEDHGSGGYAWWLNPDGSVRDGKKQTYGQAFVVYAMAEYYKACGSDEALQKALRMFALMERHCWKAQAKGYWEAASPDWGMMEDVRLSEKDMNAPFSMNTHLHVMEAYANLLAACGMDNVALATERVLDVLTNRILHPDGNRFLLFFDGHWNSLSDAISPGHDIEGSWLIWETAEILGDAGIIERVRPLVLGMTDFVRVNGVGQDGGVLNEYHPEGTRQTGRDWWPQAEGVVGFLNAFQMTGEPEYLNASIRTWRYIQDQIIDGVHGEWFAGRKADGSVMEIEKAGPWKSSYHNGRMGFEVVNRVERILNAQTDEQ